MNQPLPLNTERDETMPNGFRSCRAGADSSHCEANGARLSGDQGASLVLALVFLLVGVLLVSSLSVAMKNDLGNTSTFKNTRSLQYAASSATNLAIQNIRYTPLLSPSQTLNASPPGVCWGSGSPSTVTSIDGIAGMAAWCSTAWNPTSANTRVVTISTCLSTVSATACAANPLLQAVVTFDDYPTGGVAPPTSAACVQYCGSSMAVNNWTWKPTVPTVTAISATSGPITGGTAINITGTGFTTGSSVSFIAETSGVPLASNVVGRATSVTVNSSTSISTVAPGVTLPTSYFVVVTTPTGTSAQSPSQVFSYVSVLPVVNTISPSSGGTPGGTAVQINGTGFTLSATVSFVPVGGGTALPATRLTVNSAILMTAVSPPSATASSYYVEVTTGAGQSTGSAASTFTYNILVPTVFTVITTAGKYAGSGSCAACGGYFGGTTISISGTGFVSGDKVCMVSKASNPTPPMTSCSSSTQAAVVTLSANVITATTHSISSSATGPYYVYVLDSSGNASSLYPLFTYTSDNVP